MKDDNKTKPDHTLLGASIPAGDEPPQVYAVTDFRAFLKPGLDEELGSPAGATATPATCGTEVSCTCVPVESCACNLVTYRVGGNTCPTVCTCQCTATVTCSCTGTCSCQCTCTSTSYSYYYYVTYWYPN